MGSAVSHVYHTNPYSKAAVNERLKQLLDDSYVSNSRGVIEYILGGERDVSLLHIRVFDKKTAKVVYQRQIRETKAKGVSNCPLCAIGAQCERETHLPGGRDEGRPCDRMESRRRHKREELPDAVQDAQPGERQSLTT